MIFSFIFALILASTSWRHTDALVDNGVLGDPYVSCGANSIDVRFDTRNTFRGLVFVQDHLDDPDCRSAPAVASDGQSQFAVSGARNAQIRLNFKSCGLERRRVTSPVNGLFVLTTLVVAFHPEFLTKFDRLYKLQCFYMETQAECGKEIMVKMPPPIMQTQQVPMPTCRYEVLEGGPEGPPVFFATVGQMVYHKWTCEAEQENQFCMIVHSCTVDDGNGDRVELIDEKGCAHDKYLLQNLDYVSDLMVGKEAHVYKYADRPSMFFDCKVTLSVKEPGQLYCDVPVCPDPPRRRRRRRSDDVAAPEGHTSSLADAETKRVAHAADVHTTTHSHVEAPKEADCHSAFKLTAVTLVDAAMLVGSGLLFRNTYNLL